MRRTPRVETLALAYLALPGALFLWGWIAAPLGPLAAIALLACVLWIAGSEPSSDAPRSRVRWVPVVAVVAVAATWCVWSGIGHYTFANPDWVVRDAVLLDLVQRPWPVTYRIDDVAIVMRAPIAYFLPAALIGRVAGVSAAEFALLVWTTLGVALVFALMTRDSPTLKSTLIRVAIFVVFSGLDIVGIIAHRYAWTLGSHLEWWALVFQYSSNTTQLFWVPNHAMPGWIAMAWLAGVDPRRIPVRPAILMVVLAPLWSPLTAIGIAPMIGVVLARRLFAGDVRDLIKGVLDPRLLLVVAACLVLIFPYLTLGSEKVPSGFASDVPWVGEDIVPRYIEFCLFEFAVFAWLVLKHDPRSPATWAAVIMLLALPVYRFGPFNDLAMRGSIAPLAWLAIGMGRWLTTPHVAKQDSGSFVIALVFLAGGAATPFMEFARPFIEPRWDMNTHATLIDVTRGSHYMTEFDRPWARRFLRPTPEP